TCYCRPLPALRAVRFLQVPLLVPLSSVSADSPAPHLHTLSLHAALPISAARHFLQGVDENSSQFLIFRTIIARTGKSGTANYFRSEEHTSKLHSRDHRACRPALEK